LQTRSLSRRSEATLFHIFQGEVQIDKLAEFKN
jgi:hypothetical protein